MSEPNSALLGLDPLKVHTNVQEPILRVAVPGNPSNRFCGLLGPLLCGTQTLSHWCVCPICLVHGHHQVRDIRWEVPEVVLGSPRTDSGVHHPQAPVMMGWEEQ